MGLTVMQTTFCRLGAPMLATQCQPPAIGDAGSFDHLGGPLHRRPRNRDAKLSPG